MVFWISGVQARKRSCSSLDQSSGGLNVSGGVSHACGVGDCPSSSPPSDNMPGVAASVGAAPDGVLTALVMVSRRVCSDISIAACDRIEEWTASAGRPAAVYTVLPQDFHSRPCRKHR